MKILEQSDETEYSRSIIFRVASNSVLSKSLIILSLIKNTGKYEDTKKTLKMV